LASARAVSLDFSDLGGDLFKIPIQVSQLGLHRRDEFRFLCGEGCSHGSAGRRLLVSGLSLSNCCAVVSLVGRLAPRGERGGKEGGDH